MALQSLSRKPERVMGIDCSTKSLAFAVFDKREPLKCGEIFFEGADIYARLHDAHKKIPALVKSGVLVADYVAFEGAIQVGKNVQTGIMLAMMYGTCMSALMYNDMKVINVSPITWQSYIGNPNLKPAEKQQIKKDHPGKSASWYQNFGRELRKQRTLEIARQHFSIETGSDNVGDACGIALWALDHAPGV